MWEAHRLCCQGRQYSLWYEMALPEGGSMLRASGKGALLGVCFQAAPLYLISILTSDSLCLTGVLSKLNDTSLPRPLPTRPKNAAKLYKNYTISEKQ